MRHLIVSHIMAALAAYILCVCWTDLRASFPMEPLETVVGVTLYLIVVVFLIVQQVRLAMIPADKPAPSRQPSLRDRVDLD